MLVISVNLTDPYSTIPQAEIPTLIFCVFSVILAYGVKESAVLNVVFTAVNVAVLVFIIISGFIKGDINNWHISQEAILNATQQME